MTEQFNIEQFYKDAGVEYFNVPDEREKDEEKNKDKFDIEQFYKDAGVEYNRNERKKEYNTTPTTTNAAQTKDKYAQGEEIFDKDETESKNKLKKKDLYSYKNLNIIREYMTRSKGVDYEEA